MKNKILELLSSKSYNPLTISELAEELDFTSASDFRLLSKTLVEMEDAYEIRRSKKDRYMLINSAGFFKGPIRINKKGFGFVIQEENDIFVGRRNLGGALNNDVVLVQLVESSKGDSREGIVVKIVEPANNVIVGTYQQNKTTGYVILDDKKLNIAVDIPKVSCGGAVDGSKVIVKLGKKIGENKYSGVVEKVIGHKNDPGVDILSAIYSHNIEIEFSNETLEYIKTISDELTSEDLKGRTDLRKKVITTIDGDDAKDLDDAISIEKLANGNYLLGVHIADVSYYVKEKTPLDVDASSRATSVYLVDRVVPMLPQYLSNNICSLNEGVDRLTMTCEMEVDCNGKVVSYNIFPSVINSNARMTYNNVNKIIKGDSEVIAQYQDLVPMFNLMNELALIIRKERSERGSLDFDVPESKIIVNDKSEVIDIIARERFDAERLIEDFMILANETVASHFFMLDVPFVYRIHGTPKEAKITQFIHIARVMGHKIKTTNNAVSNFTIRNIIDSLTDEQGYVLKTLLLRSMQKAVYDVNNIGHFGLASKCYTHFTSPIRRYPDLIVHRLIRKYLINNEYNVPGNFLAMLEEQAMHSSLKEREAMECEFDVNDMKKAEYMHKFIGEEFSGIVSSVTNFGMFIELPNTVEGLIRLADMNDDFYEYDEKRLMVCGRRSGVNYKLGQKVKVIVVAATKETGEIDFKLSR